MDYLDKVKLLQNDRRNIIIIVFIGLIVRFLAIDYGLPSTYNSTEYFIAKNALSFGARQSLAPLNFIYPTLYTYFITVFFALYFLVGKLFTWFPTVPDFAVQFLVNPSSFYLLGRSLSALLIICSAVILYKVCRFMLNPVLSLSISLGMFFSFNIFYFTFWMVPDGLLVCGTTITLYFIVKNNHHILSIWELLISSIICGLTISTKYNAGFLAAGWIGAVFLTQGLDLSHRWGRILISLFFVMIGFFMGSPYWILAFSKFVAGFRMILTQAQYAYNVEAGLPYIWEVKELIMSEWLLGLIFLSILMYMIYSFDRFTLPLILVVFPTFILVGWWTKKGLDYILVIFPVLLVMLAYIFSKISGKRKECIVFSVIIFFALFMNIIRILYTDFLFRQKDTRQLTGIWIKENIPSGTAICYDHYHYDIDLIDFDRYIYYGEGSKYLNNSIKEKLIELQNSMPHYRFISSQIRKGIPNIPDSLFQIVSGDSFLWQIYTNPHKSLSQITSEGTKILILNSFTYDKYLQNKPPGPDNPLRYDFLTRRKFYEEIFSRLIPVITLEPSWNRAGPAIKIYNLQGIANENVNRN
jgi:hypothetical protein